jgi:hypothetical protein
MARRSQSSEAGRILRPQVLQPVWARAAASGLNRRAVVLLSDPWRGGHRKFPRARDLRQRLTGTRIKNLGRRCCERRRSAHSHRCQAKAAPAPTKKSAQPSSNTLISTPEKAQAGVFSRLLLTTIRRRRVVGVKPRLAFAVVRNARGAEGVVGARGIEPLTPSMSRKCSPAELSAL